MPKNNISGLIDKRIIGVSSKAKLKTAIDLMKNTNVGIMPVLDDTKLVGVLDEQFVLESASKDISQLIDSAVGSVMKKPFYISASESIDDAIDYIIAHKASRIPVVDSEQNMRCLGLISATEILDFKIKMQQ